MILLLVVLIYVPIVVANPSGIAYGLNYLMDTLLLAAAPWLLPERCGSICGSSIQLGSPDPKIGKYCRIFSRVPPRPDRKAIFRKYCGY
jgi:hypothetical protein